MTASLRHAQPASNLAPLRSRRLQIRALAAALISLTGCANGGYIEAADDESETVQTASADPTRAALHNGAYATPETSGGFCVQGVGVYLSAVNDTGELTLYVVAPAQSATFVRPALYLTMQESEHSQTELAEFDDVTLQAGESFVLRKEADGPLLEVFADFDGD